MFFITCIILGQCCARRLLLFSITLLSPSQHDQVPAALQMSRRGIKAWPVLKPREQAST